MFKTIRNTWSGRVMRGAGVAIGAGRARARQGERYPTHTLVTLPDGQLMRVRNASLAAAKDLLAARNTIERRQREERAARVTREVVEAAR